ncbi:MAG: hypothetical protein H6511_06660 [Holophagales bacterium]|nr:hypothetical protein [Holophagales bacterium]
MRRAPLVSALLLLARFAVPAAGAEAPAVSVRLEPPAITVGDPVEATLEVVVAGDGANVRFPDWSKGWGAAEVLEAGAPERTPVGEGARIRQVLRLTAFQTGEVELPPVTVRFGEGDASATTPASLKLEVRSVLPPEEKEAEPLPAEPPRSFPLPNAALWTIAAFVVAIAAALWLARRRAAGGGRKAALAPFAELLAALAALPEAAPEPGHARLSEALRRYLGRALGFPAVESSTREVERALAGRHIEPSLVQRTVRLLRDSDLVKFGRRPATAGELAGRAGEARALAEAVEHHLRPEPVEGEAKEAAA